MKRQLLPALVLALVFAETAAAESSGTIWLSWLRSTGDNRLLHDSSVGPVDFALRSGVGLSLSGELVFAPRWNLQGMVTYVRPEAIVSAGGFEVELGSVEMIPLSAALQFELVDRAEGTLYASAGVAWVHFGRVEGEVLDLLDVEEIDLDDGAAYLLGAGGSYVISPRVALAADLRYFPVESAISASEEFPVEIDLNPLIVSVGVRIRR